LLGLGDLKHIATILSNKIIYNLVSDDEPVYLNHIQKLNTVI
jgi:hypothetical protein